MTWKTTKAASFTIAVLSAAVVAVSLLCGCGNGNGPDGKTQSVESSMTVKNGREFTISLKSNPTTGFQWQLAEPLDEKVVVKVDSVYKQDSTGGSSAVGVGGVETWTFRATGKGETDIEMEYVRPWEKDVKPAEERVFHITVE